MQKIKKILVQFILGSFLITAFPINTFAYTEDYTAVLRISDQIIIRYRVYEGRLQYRRWNATDGEWLDPEWIDY